MRAAELQTYFETHAAQMLNSDLQSAAARLAFPAAIYIGKHLMVLSRAEDAEAALHVFQRTLVFNGVRHMHCEVDAVELPRAGRQRAWVQWSYQNAAGQELRRDQVMYVLRNADAPHTAQIEMMEYTALAFPALVEELPLAR
ncbi:MAG: hypothetical protein AAF218_06940 [Pseudomonadota bacterium]